jgi:curved DNA-binding protein
MDVRDYYQTLGVPRTATAAEIKKAFRKIARESHPDKKPGDRAAEQRFKDINEANEVLSDPEKRAKYDRFGKDWEAYERAAKAGGGTGAPGAGAAGGDPFGPGGPFAGYSVHRGGPGGGIRYEFRTAGGGTGSAGGTAGFSDFFETLFGDGGFGERADLGGFGAPGGAGASGPGGGRRVLAPVEATAGISLEEAFHGATRIVEVDGRRLEVTIPPGVDTNSRVRLSGKGPDGRDLVVVIQVQPHRVFTRHGADLEREIPVTLREALLGGEVPVRTLKGRVLLTLPAGTQGGKSFRLSGQGMPRLKGGVPGDLYVKVLVVLPTHLAPEAEEAAARFLDLAHQPDPRA